MNTQDQNAVTEAELEAALAGLPELNLDDMTGASEPEPVAEPVIDVLEEHKAAPAVVEHDLADLDLALSGVESYEEQESAPIDTSEDAKPKAQPAKARTTRAARTATTPKDLSAVPAEFFALEPGVTDNDKAKADFLAAMPDQVKVVEKISNALMSLSAGRLPCNYTMVAFQTLDAKKSVTVADLVAAYKMTPKGRGGASGMIGEGTARAQAGQMGVLLPKLGLATRVGKTLELNPTSLVAERIRAIAA